MSVLHQQLCTKNLFAAGFLVFPFMIERFNIIAVNISDRDLKLFSLVDSTGKEVAAGELGLLLYRGGTVYDSYGNNDFNRADIICRELNFTYSIKWTNNGSFAIQSNYDVHIKNVECDEADWNRCRYYQADSNSQSHEKDVYLSCTGKKASVAIINL